MKMYALRPTSGISASKWINLFLLCLCDTISVNDIALINIVYNYLYTYLYLLVTWKDNHFSISQNIYHHALHSIDACWICLTELRGVESKEGENSENVDFEPDLFIRHKAERSSGF